MRKNWQYVILVIQMIIIGSLIKGIWQTVGSEKRVDELISKKNILEGQKREVELKIKESESDYYLEKIAREQLHMVKEGETVIILSDETLSNNEIKPSEEVIIKPNWKKWVDVLFKE
ncbi:MAG: septum formation initiator family protein [bacterium]